MFNGLTVQERIERAEILLCMAQAKTNIYFRAVAYTDMFCAV